MVGVPSNMQSTMPKPFIKGPLTSRLLDLFDWLREKRRKYDETSCAIINGESGSGKSEIAKRYASLYPRVEESERTYIPVLHIALPSIASKEELLKIILVKLGDPQRGEGAKNANRLLDRLGKLLKTTGVELLIFDEVQGTIERRSNKVITGIADLYKELIDITKIPIVFMGMPWSVHLIDSNSQLRRRVTYRFVLPPFKISDEESLRDYMRFMCILAEKFGFADSINLRDIATCYRIFSYTEGNLGVTYELFRDVYMRADSDGCAANYDVMKKVVARYRDRGATNPLELAIDKVRFRE